MKVATMFGEGGAIVGILAWEESCAAVGNVGAMGWTPSRVVPMRRSRECLAAFSRVRQLAPFSLVDQLAPSPLAENSHRSEVR